MTAREDSGHKSYYCNQETSVTNIMLVALVTLSQCSALIGDITSQVGHVPCPVEGTSTIAEVPLWLASDEYAGGGAGLVLLAGPLPPSGNSSA